MKLTAYQRSVLSTAISDQDTLAHVINTLENTTKPLNDEPQPRLESMFIADNIDLITNAIDFLPISFYIKDRNSRFVFANLQTIHTLRCRKHSDVIGKTDFELMLTRDATTHYNNEQALMRTGTAILNEEIFIDEKYGAPQWLLSSKQPIRNGDGRVIGLVGINIDITNQKESEQDLRAEQNLLRTLIDALDQQIFIKDLESRFIIANHHVVEGAGAHSYEAIVGKTDFDYLPLDIAQRFYEQEQEIIRTGKPILAREVRQKLGTSTTADQWWQTTKVPLYDEFGKIVGIVGFNRDITEQKHAQQREIGFELEHTRRKVLSDFIAGSSHEFRTPISAINSAVYLLSKTEDPDKRAYYIEKINRHTDTLTRLIDMMNQMMEFDRGIRLHPETFPAQPFFEELLHDFAKRGQSKQLTMQLDLSATASTLYGDPILLKRALHTLVDNAITYSNDEDTIILSSTTDDNNAIISVRDTGIGMTEETLERIFERFYRGDKSRSQSGFGLGLSIAERIIKLHHGDITVTSEIDIGSEFIVTLPLRSVYHDLTHQESTSPTILED